MLRQLVGLLAVLRFPDQHPNPAPTTHAPTPPSPIVVHTWPFLQATDAAWNILRNTEEGGGDGGGGTALEAVEAGASACERYQCDGTVGYGGSPDENGETTLDALVMNGDTLEVGAVASLRHIKEAVKTARLVMQHTTHTLLAGLQAAEFATQMGLEPFNLTTEHSARLHSEWRQHHCQPNFRTNVVPDPTQHCGPYKRHQSQQQQQQQEQESQSKQQQQQKLWPNATSHDTISVIAIDSQGSMAAACSSNGAIHKVPGRVGDCAIAGASAYVDSEVGGCGATGDGDLHLRFLPCYQVVENMRGGMNPKAAAEDVVRRIQRKVGVERYTGALVAVGRGGRHGAASSGGWKFQYAWRDGESTKTHIVTVDSLHHSPAAT